MNGEQVSICMAQPDFPLGGLHEALSERLIRNGALETWRDLFLGSAYGTIRFETASCTVLASDDPLEEDFDSDLLAKRLGATAQPSAAADRLFAFSRALAAVRAAVVLQRLAPKRKLRTAVRTFECTVASFELAGRTHEVVLGEAIALAEAALAHVAAGTISICPTTYALVGDRIGDQAPEAMIATESADDAVTQASITLPPQVAGDLSTFAGIGLT